MGCRNYLHSLSTVGLLPGLGTDAQDSTTPEILPIPVATAWSSTFRSTASIGPLPRAQPIPARNGHNGNLTTFHTLENFRKLVY